MNILDIIALADWVTPSVSATKQIVKGKARWPAYQGSGRDLELAANALRKAGIDVEHHGFARAIIVNPNDMGKVDHALALAGFKVNRRGFIKRVRK